MKNLIINLFIILSCVPFGNIFGFPGDHEGYSCPGFRSENCLVDDNDVSKPAIPYLDPTNPSINPACGADLEHNPSNPIHNPDYHFTMFGDSLTDFVHDYGFFQFDAYFADAGFPVSVQNFGKHGETADGITYNIGARPGYYYTADGEKMPIADILLNRCQPIGHNTRIWLGQNMVPDKTASRSLIMAGGNDVIHSQAAIFAFPFLKKHFMAKVADDIGKFVDWNLENGKSVVLQGTIPINSYGLHDYDTNIVNRVTLCNGITVSIEPWWLVIVVPGLAEALMQYLDYAIDTYSDFWEKIFHDTLKGALINSSITQACINDKLRDEVAPVYQQHYPGRVKMIPLYDFFSEARGNYFAKNFWLPYEATYWKNTHDIVETPSSLFDSITYQPLLGGLLVESPIQLYRSLADLTGDISLSNFVQYFSAPIDMGISDPNTGYDYLSVANLLYGISNALVEIFQIPGGGSVFGVDYNSKYDPYIDRENPLDPIHIGPYGYGIWAKVVGTYLNDTTNWITQVDTQGSVPIDGQEMYVLNQYIITKRDAIRVNTPAFYSVEPSYEVSAVNSWSGIDGRCQNYKSVEPWPFPDIHYQICIANNPAVPDSEKRAYATKGAIRQHWIDNGGPSWFGFPTSDEMLAGLFDIDRCSNFERGYIYWSPIHGIRDVVEGKSCP